MSERLRISRRDFMNGVALSLAAGGALSPLEILAQLERPAQAAGGPYPPAFTGMRGAHPGSFEVAHALSSGAATWARPEARTDDIYDLIVVGGGISGLAAAFLYQQRTGGDARILILDNHDDFGGHAKRNEFDVDGRALICYGGSQSIDTPGHYSAVSKKLLMDLAIHTERFYDYYDQAYFEDRKLRQGLYFSRETYGTDSVQPNVLRTFFSTPPDDVAAVVNGYPLSEGAKRSLIRLLKDETDYLAGKSRDEKIRTLRATSYTEFLTKIVGAPEEVALLSRDTIKGLWGVGWDALSALEAYRTGMPGTDHLGIGELGGEPPGRDEPYIFHFPDGNAGIARALVRALIPDAIPGKTMEDLVLAQVDYSRLDRRSSANRIRLSSTAVDVRHAEDGRHVDVTYVTDEQPHRVRGRHTVLACDNAMIPHLCKELPTAQRDAIAYATKVPLVYISVAVRNWKAFENLGYGGFHIPQGILMHSFGMDFPVTMGGYSYTEHSTEPTVIHGSYVPTDPGKGLDAREQHIAGRRKLYELSFNDFERDTVRQMSGALESGGFDAERDIAAITVNRWPHGYAYEYNDYSDPPDWGPDTGPHIAGRAQMGRISIANADASAYAYVNGAIDAADRAVNEQLAT